MYNDDQWNMSFEGLNENVCVLSKSASIQF